MLIRKYQWFFYTLYNILLFLCESNGEFSSCLSKNTCGSCIQTVGCVWCSQEDEGSFKRCLNENEILNNTQWCDTKHIINPKSTIDVLQKKRIRAGNGTQDPVQISPQKIRMTLRVGEEKEINFKYQRASEYPIDLYYLMDLSFSMYDDKDNLFILGTELSSTMKSLTNNLRMGFGSFVDKPEFPFANPNTDFNPSIRKLNDGSKVKCAPTYSFQNHFPLSENISLFVKKVKESNISTNNDEPEGGFDALMQVLVCRSQIGWRDKARKIVVFATDEDFHMAGEGKFLGIVEPNDSACHLDKDGSYTHALLQDYPSITMLDMEARENNINVIFAAPKYVETKYRLLKENIHGAAFGILSEDSSNVVNLIKEKYDEIVDSVYFSDNAEEPIEIKYYSTCGESIEKQTTECLMKGKPKLNVRAVFKALHCPENNEKWKQTIYITLGQSDERLEVEVVIVCQCDCEKDTKIQTVMKAKECHGGGVLECGICSCDSGRYGKFCECSGNDFMADQQACVPDNTTEQICSGLGNCKCGKCVCDERDNVEERIYGTNCECNNYSCERNKGLVCSGPDRGHCDCGQCICKAGWSGKACECRENNSTCIAPLSKEICSGHGICSCGSCQCDATEHFRYSGKFCDECPHCSATKCEELKDCVECQVHKTGIYSESECILKCTAFQTEIVDQITNGNESINDISCMVPDEKACIIKFKYVYEEDGMSVKVYAQKDKECLTPMGILEIVLSVIGSILIAGLVLLAIWKILTTVHDEREYQNFKRERLLAKWDRGENPLFKPSTTFFKNPTFEGQELN